MKERENILRILIETERAIKNENPHPLKELSAQTVHSASTTGDPDNIAVAVIVYALGKIFERTDYRTLSGWNSFRRIAIASLNASINDLQNDNISKFRKDFSLIRKGINKVSGKLGKYIEDVFKKAQINKASKIYEHGISMGKTAQMLGISLYDLQSYAGQSDASEVKFNQTINIKTRIKMLEDFFG